MLCILRVVRGLRDAEQSCIVEDLRWYKRLGGTLSTARSLGLGGGGGVRCVYGLTDKRAVKAALWLP